MSSENPGNHSPKEESGTRMGHAHAETPERHHVDDHRAEDVLGRGSDGGDQPRRGSLNLCDIPVDTPHVTPSHAIPPVASRRYSTMGMGLLDPVPQALHDIEEGVAEILVHLQRQSMLMTRLQTTQTQHGKKLRKLHADIQSSKLITMQL